NGPGDQLCSRICRMPWSNVVVASRQEVNGNGYLPQIDGLVGEINSACVLQYVSVVHVAQIVGLHLGRHAGRIRIPVQNVECCGTAAQQVVVDDKEPDQIVFTHEVECLGHVATFEVAKAIHVLVGKLELVFVDEDRDVADIGKIQERREQRGGGDASVVCGGHIGERAGNQSSADAIPYDIDLRFSGRLFDRRDGLQRTLKHIIGKTFIGEFGTGIDPGDHENRVALIYTPLDE